MFLRCEMQKSDGTRWGSLRVYVAECREAVGRGEVLNLARGLANYGTRSKTSQGADQKMLGCSVAFVKDSSGCSWPFATPWLTRWAGVVEPFPEESRKKGCSAEQSGPRCRVVMEPDGVL